MLPTLPISLLKPAGGAGYVAPAVHFDGSTWLNIASLTATDNAFNSFVVWLNITASEYNNAPTVWIADPTGAFLNYFQGLAVSEVQFSAGGAGGSGSNSSSAFPSGWLCFIGTTKTSGDKPASAWYGAASSDGSKLITAGETDAIYISSDGGASWTESGSGNDLWIGVATSSDGSVIAAVAQGNSVSISTNGGTSFSPSAVSGASSLLFISSSSNGSHLLTAESGGFLYVSTNTGSSWTQRASSLPWSAVSSSSSGATLVAVTSSNHVYVSTDSGTSWTLKTDPPSASLQAVCISADGATIFVASFDVSATNTLFKSTDGGSSWTDITPAGSVGKWYAIDCSTDAQKIIAVGNDGGTFISSNGGSSWTSHDAGTHNWVSASMSGDGSKILLGAAFAGGTVTTSADSGASWQLRQVQDCQQFILYVGDRRNFFQIKSSASNFTLAFNGKQFQVGNDTFGDVLIGDVADLRVMPGVSLLTGSDIALATRRLFIDGSGKPVDPAIATAALGAPGAVLFSGDKDGFVINQGTGGVPTLTGALTNASSSPSD